MDTKEVKLPSGKVAVIRTYTTRRDDVAASEILKKGMKVTSVGGVESIEMSPEAVLDSECKYVELLTKSIDGKTENIAEMLLDLRSDDYKALEDEVGAVTKVNSPKAASKS